MTLHDRAFRLYTYWSHDRREQEMIWNSRSGDVPMCVLNKERMQMLKFDPKVIENTTRSQFHVPSIGDRVFIAMPYDVALGLSRDRLTQKYKKVPLEEELQAAAKKLYANGQMAHLVTVDDSLYRAFKRKAEAAGQ